MAGRLRNSTSRYWFWLGVFLFTGLLLVPSVEAIHEVSYRYVVLGYVRDGAGRPVAGAEVRVTREKTGFFYRVQTDVNGFYLVALNLHDEDLGDALQVAAGRAAIRVEARFNPLDAQGHRGTRVDFWGNRAEERQGIFAETLKNYLKK